LGHGLSSTLGSRREINEKTWLVKLRLLKLKGQIAQLLDFTTQSLHIPTVGCLPCFSKGSFYAGIQPWI